LTAICLVKKSKKLQVHLKVKTLSFDLKSRIRVSKFEETSTGNSDKGFKEMA
jgi:hypothetical protein